MPFILMYDTLNLVQKQKFYGLKKSLYFIRFWRSTQKSQILLLWATYTLFFSKTHASNGWKKIRHNPSYAVYVWNKSFKCMLNEKGLA